MRDGSESLDLTARCNGVALTASSLLLDSQYLIFAGTIIDPEFAEPSGAPVPVQLAMHVSLAPEFADGAHVERETTWLLEADDGEQSEVSWVVESHELPDNYALQDALARVSDLEIRAFAIEDLVVTVGVGLALAIGGLKMWLDKEERGNALQTADRQYRECLESGGSPTIKFGVESFASLTPEARLKIKSGICYEVRCERNRE
jgi:hypothetical protein